MDTHTPVSAAALAPYHAAARELGTAHGSAGLMPYVDAARPSDDYSRTIDRYTSYVGHEDGILILLAALGLPAPDADQGPWYDACLRITHEYLDAYDSAVQAWPPLPGFMTANGLAALLRHHDIFHAEVVTTSTGTIAVTGTLEPEGRGFTVNAAPASGADQPLPLAVTLHLYEDGAPARPLDPDEEGDSVERGIDPAEVIVQLVSALQPGRPEPRPERAPNRGGSLT